MPFEMRERELPGVGVRYELDLSHDESLATSIHNSGRRGLYYRGEDDEDYKEVVVVGDQSAHERVGKSRMGTMRRTLEPFGTVKLEQRLDESG